MSQWRDEVKLLPQTLINLKFKLPKPETEALAEFSKTENEALGGQGRVLVRASGTEPLLRVMVEGDNADAMAEQVIDRLKQKFKIG